MRMIPAFVLLLALTACGAQTRSGDTAATATHTTSGSPAVDAVTASQPREVADLTNQKMVYECPKCGMNFEGPGQCTMDGGELVQTEVSYLCPADNQEVEKAGKCPRCPMNARVVKSAVAVTPTPSKPLRRP